MVIIEERELKEMKDKLCQWIEEKCADVSKEIIELGFLGYDVKLMQQELEVSNESIKRTLKNLLDEEKIIKVKTKIPRYFSKKRLEELYSIQIENCVVTSIKACIEEAKETEPLTKEDIFDAIIGAQQSLKKCIEKAKAAMIYPPRGLHTLLTGPSGVGKSMFSELMFNYAKSKNVLSKDAKLVVLNCADYANNPQLLIGMLFGYVKGSFTGANEDKDGLVEEANNGILFLDEIHRLPPEGQEMLFLLLDKGIYRRIGESSGYQKSNVLLIGATTANIHTTFLETFKRRIHMIVEIPALSERTVEERYNLIMHFLAIEQSMIQSNIIVEPVVMKALLSYTCVGNVGQLMTDIKMICAQAFLDYRTNGLENVYLKREHLNDSVMQGIIKWNEVQDRYVGFHIDKQITIDSNLGINNSEEIAINNIYDHINNKYLEFLHVYKNKDIINNRLKNYINEYLIHILGKYTNQKEKQRLQNLINPAVYQVIHNVIDYAKIRLQRDISDDIFVAMCLHLASLIEDSKRKTSINHEILDIIRDNELEYSVAKEMKEDIEYQLNIKLDDNEIFMLTLFLCMDNNRKRSKITILVLCHGDGVAKHMVEVAKNLIQCDNVYAMDMNLQENALQFYSNVEEKVKEIVNQKGILLLVDMGSLCFYKDMLNTNLGVEAKVISRVNTPLVLEAARKTMVNEISLSELYDDLKDNSPYIAKNINEDLSKDSSKKDCILITCLTGVGTAKKLEAIIRKALKNLIDNIEILTCNKEEYATLDISFYRIIANVGTINLNIKDVPYISTSDVIVGDGLSELYGLISNINGEKEEVNLPNYMLEKVLCDQLTFLNPIKIHNYSKTSYIQIEKELHYGENKNAYVAFVLHVSSMVERAIQRQQFSNSMNVVIDETFEICEKNLKEIESVFNIQLTKTEISLVADIFRYYK